jgi:hypothetical protein
MTPLLQRFAPQLANINIRPYFAPQMIPQANEALQRLCASCEVSQGIFFIVELLMPTRSLITLYLWWQYLRMRYMADRSGHVKAAFVDIDNKINGLLQYQ